MQAGDLSGGDDDKYKLAQLEFEVHDELCRARSEPQSYIPRLQARLDHFVGMKYAPPELGGQTQLVTMEGCRGVEDAIEFLAKQSSLPAFILEGEESFSQCGDKDRLARVYFKDDKAERRKAAIAKSKQERWLAFCWEGPAISSASKIVEDLIIDDGDFDRNHRLAVFNRAHVMVRIQVRKNRKGRILCKLHFSTTMFNSRPCRICGRCYSCDYSCSMCWSLHHSSVSSVCSSRPQTNGSSRPQTTSPRQGNEQTSPQQPLSLPSSPSAKSSGINSANTSSDFGADSPTRRPVREFLSESPVARHTYLSYSPLEGSFLLPRSDSAPSFSPQHIEACRGSQSTPGTPSVAVRARARPGSVISKRQDLKAKLADMQALKPWYHQMHVPCGGRLKASPISRSLPHLQMLYT